jgi:hypothetical protein
MAVEDGTCAAHFEVTLHAALQMQLQLAMQQHMRGWSAGEDAPYNFGRA